ncbi:MAG: hypothetical protein MJ197_03555 [Bacteroidales bacterium]|nr:hypothetical protein [Bacteroidales bacterium]
MEEKELSVQEINEIVQEAKKQVKTNASKGIHVVITAMKKNIDTELSPYFDENNFRAKDRDSIIASFNEAIDNLISNVNYLCFRCVIKSSNNVKLIWEKTITIRPGHSVYIYKSESPNKEKADLSILSQKESFNNAIYQVLGLMGFDQEHLDGVAQNEFKGFGAVMAIRERNLENKFIQAEKDKKLEELISTKTKLEFKVENLNKELENERKYTEGLEDKIEELNDEIEELNKLKPESSLLGTSIVAALTKAGTNLAIKHADVIGGLAGVSKEEMVSMLKSADEQPTTTITNDANVDVTPVSPRSEYIDAIGKFVDTLEESEFNELWSLMQSFANDKTLITQAVKSIINE